MQGYLLPIVLAGLLAVPRLWRIGSGLSEAPATLANGETGTATPAATEAKGDGLKIRSFSLGGSEVRLEFSTVDDLPSPASGDSHDLLKTRFGKSDGD